MPLHIVRSDITAMKCDAIVNTTNRDMIGYSGVDLAVHTKAGPALEEACRSLVPLELGFAKITEGFGLDCKYIIHTSGPVWEGGNRGEKALLKSCYIESLNLAAAHNCHSVAFPLISSGAYGYPKDQVLTFAVEVIAGFLEDHEMTVFLCVFDSESYEFSRTLFHDIQTFLAEETLPFEKVVHLEQSHCSCNTRRLEEGDYLPAMTPNLSCAPAPGGSLDDFLKNMHDGFSETLLSFIDRKGLTDVECYKRANVDRKVFSRIRCKKGYKPAKTTAVAFAVALELTLEETEELLASAGYALSHSSKFDMIVTYFILNGRYNIHEINEALFEFDQVLLGAL